MNGIIWSEQLDRIFVTNYESDPSLTWQYFGSSTGFMRQYPGTCCLLHIIVPFTMSVCVRISCCAFNRVHLVIDSLI